MSVTGPPGSGPWRAGIAVSDTASGTFLTQGVLAALLVRERTGCGQWVHTSLLEAMVNFMDFQATRWLIDGVVPGQAGNDHPTIVPMGTYQTADGAINIAAVMGWERFLEAIEGEELADDPGFATWEARSRNGAALHEAIEQKLSRRGAAEWVEILNDAGLPCGPVLALDEVFADPQVQHLNLTRKVEHEQDGEVELLRLPLTFSDTPAGVSRAAPLPGAHTREVLSEYGFSEDEIAALADSGAVAVESRGGAFGG
jgi:crotonobetainyl-CoA:carnitine CoA-transferase CaiB-like acyl-CoA transferase